MRPKLTVVVPCTDRKSAPATQECLVRHLPKLSLTERHDSWRQRIDQAVDKKPLSLLYAGDAWRRTESVMSAAATAGFEPTLYVASAGLGLVGASSLAPAYGATFTAGQDDSVASSVAGKRDWWTHFAGSGGNTLPEVSGDATLVVLSAAYASALDADLAELAETRGEHLLVGGSRDLLGLPRIKSDLGLRHALGGTSLSLNLRMAEAWLRGLTEPKLTDASRMKCWVAWADGVRRTEHYDRKTMTDLQVLKFIHFLKGEESTVLRTRALRQLRDSGHACEQKRFARLFAQTVQA
jgi:hypothetical protein